MDKVLREKIKTELRAYLKREPTETEVMNGQSDVNIMQKVQVKENMVTDERVKKLEQIKI